MVSKTISLSEELEKLFDLTPETEAFNRQIQRINELLDSMGKEYPGDAKIFDNIRCRISALPIVYSSSKEQANKIAALKEKVRDQPNLQNQLEQLEKEYIPYSFALTELTTLIATDLQSLGR